MPSRVGEVQTIAASASTYLQRLCKHFGKKIEVTYTEEVGHAHFPFGYCRMTADDDRLKFECRTPDHEGMQRMQHVIDQHVGMFTKRDPLRVAWRETPVE